MTTNLEAYFNRSPVVAHASARLLTLPDLAASCSQPAPRYPSTDLPPSAPFLRRSRLTCGTSNFSTEFTTVPAVTLMPWRPDRGCRGFLEPAFAVWCRWSTSRSCVPPASSVPYQSPLNRLRVRWRGDDQGENDRRHQTLHTDPSTSRGSCLPERGSASIIHPPYPIVIAIEPRRQPHVGRGRRQKASGANAHRTGARQGRRCVIGPTADPQSADWVPRHRHGRRR
jgi:hypothetical protein